MTTKINKLIDLASIGCGLIIDAKDFKYEDIRKLVYTISYNNSSSLHIKNASLLGNDNIYSFLRILYKNKLTLEL